MNLAGYQTLDGTTCRLLLSHINLPFKRLILKKIARTPLVVAE